MEVEAKKRERYMSLILQLGQQKVHSLRKLALLAEPIMLLAGGALTSALHVLSCSIALFEVLPSTTSFRFLEMEGLPDPIPGDKKKLMAKNRQVTG